MMIDLKIEKSDEIVGEFLESVAGWGGSFTSYHSFRYLSHPLFLLARFPCLRLPIFRNPNHKKKSTHDLPLPNQIIQLPHQNIKKKQLPGLA